MGTNEVANGIGRRLLSAYEDQVAELTPQLARNVARELGLPAIPADSAWLTGATEAVRVFLGCVAADDLDRITAEDSIFRRVGRECALVRVPAETLAAGIRSSTRRTQAQVHRFVLADEGQHDSEGMLVLLSRIVAAGEMAVEAAMLGHLGATEPADDDAEVRARRLATALLAQDEAAEGLARDVGWPERSLVTAVVTTHEGAEVIAGRSEHVPGRHVRSQDVVLMVPVDEGRLATVARPLVDGTPAVVGPALPFDRLHDSLDLAARAAELRPEADDAVFVDDVLLELASTADPTVVDALRRKHFADLDALPPEQRELLVDTLREWLLQWGHRPGIARTLGVHPQTVSGRIQRLKDLLADDLEDPRVRSELLVLLLADAQI